MKTYILILFSLFFTQLWANETQTVFDSLVFQKGSNTFLIKGNGSYQVLKNSLDLEVKLGQLPDSIVLQLNKALKSLPATGDVVFEHSNRYPKQELKVFRNKECLQIQGNSLFPEPYVELQQLYGLLEYEMLTNVVYTNKGFINIEGKNVLCWYIHHKRILEEMPGNYRSWPGKSELVFYVIPPNRKYLKCEYDYILYLPELPKYFDMETGMRIPNPEKPTIVDTTDAEFLKRLLKDMNRYSCR